MQHSRVLYVVVLTMVVLGCKKPLATSDLSYGHMAGIGWTRHTVFAIPPPSVLAEDGQPSRISIGLCDNSNGGRFNGEINTAFQEWLGPYAAFYELKPSCTEKHLITVDSASSCQTANAIAETIPIVGNFKREFEDLSWVIRMCKPEKVARAVILHELGHVFGQCDRYLSKDTDGIYHPMQGANCDTLPQASDGKFTEPSAMQVPGPDHPQQVTIDDLRGVKSFLLRVDIPGNVAWQQFLDAKLPQWRE